MATCKVCGKEFKPRKRGNIICPSAECKLINKNNLVKQNRDEKRARILKQREAREAGRVVPDVKPAKQMTVDESYRALCAAVIENAVVDAKKKQPGPTRREALDFLIRDGGGFYAEMIGVHPDWVRRWASNGFRQVGKL